MKKTHDTEIVALEQKGKASSLLGMCYNHSGARPVIEPADWRGRGMF